MGMGTCIIWWGGYWFIWWSEHWGFFDFLRSGGFASSDLKIWFFMYLGIRVFGHFGIRLFLELVIWLRLQLSGYGQYFQK